MKQLKNFGIFLAVMVLAMCKQSDESLTQSSQDSTASVDMNCFENISPIGPTKKIELDGKKMESLAGLRFTQGICAGDSIAIDKLLEFSTATIISGSTSFTSQLFVGANEAEVAVYNPTSRKIQSIGQVQANGQRGSHIEGLNFKIVTGANNKKLLKIWLR
jgi:hypothetical protein